MLVFKTIQEIKTYYSQNNIESIGFVPTMGALHRGHLSLIETSKDQNEITICSIFVNPKQFNKQEDLVNYPRDNSSDIAKLKEVGCDVVFIPSVEEIYPDKESKTFDFGILSEVMEAEHRPGHFNGVALVIERFFEILEPTHAYFGEKDFQQLAVVKALTRQINSSVKIIGCPIYREQNGLAMSSRNERLTAEEKEVAKAIKEGLDLVKIHYKNYPLQEIKEHFKAKIEKHKELSLEYFEIADAATLKPIKNWEDAASCIAFTAVNIRTVRLIDNMTIIS